MVYKQEYKTLRRKTLLGIYANKCPKVEVINLVFLHDNLCISQFWQCEHQKFSYSNERIDILKG